jgi:hypothetical protein
MPFSGILENDDLLIPKLNDRGARFHFGGIAKSVPELSSKAQFHH